MKVHILKSAQAIETVEGDASHLTSVTAGEDITVTHTLADRLVAMGLARKIEPPKAPEKAKDGDRGPKA